MRSTKKSILRNSTYILCALFFLGSCSSPATNRNYDEGKKDTQGTDTIVIAQMQFTPAELSVKPGDTVIWINNDMVDHDVTSDKKNFFYSDTIHVGKMWKMVVKDSASYHCSIHPTMQARLILK